jgi:hypothetical protein
MTAGLRRGARRCQSHDLSNRLAAVREHRAAHLGALPVSLLGQDRVREVVALAVFLK